MQHLLLMLASGTAICLMHEVVVKLAQFVHHRNTCHRSVNRLPRFRNCLVDAVHDSSSAACASSCSACLTYDRGCIPRLAKSRNCAAWRNSVSRLLTCDRCDCGNPSGNNRAVSRLSAALCARLLMCPLGDNSEWSIAGQLISSILPLVK